MKRFAVVFLLCGFFLTGCVMNLGRLSVAGARNIDLSTAEFQKVQENVAGISVHHTIIIFSVSEYPKISNAVADALEKANGDIMTDVEIKYKWWYIPLIYGKGYYEVRGNVWKIKKKSSTNAEDHPWQPAIQYSALFESASYNSGTAALER